MAITTDSPNGAGDMGAMILLRAVKSCVVVRREIPTPNIINVSIPIIIYTIHKLIGVHPGIGCQVGVRVVKTLINDPDINRF